MTPALLPTTPIPPSTETRVIEPSTAKRVPPPRNPNIGSSVTRLNLLAASPKAPSADKATGAQQQTTQRKVKPTPITAGTANVAFPPDPTSPLHQKPNAPFRFGQPTQATRLEVSSKPSSSRLLTVDGTFSFAIYSIRGDLGFL